LAAAIARAASRTWSGWSGLAWAGQEALQIGLETGRETTYQGRGFRWQNASRIEAWQIDGHGF
jgi:hypothetical protein